MIKLCEVLAFNKTTHIVVAKYDGIQIQFVTDKDSLGYTVYIKKNASKYEIVEKSEYEKSLKATKKKDKTEKYIVSEGIDASDIAD